MLPSKINKIIAEKSMHVHHGEVRHSFFAPEFIQYERGPMWYLGVGIFSLVVVVLGVLTHSLTFVLAYTFFAAVYFLIHHHESDVIEVAITQHGIRIGSDFFPYGEIRNFWLVHKPPFVADLKLHIARRFQPIVTIHIFGQDPLALRALLAPHIVELPDKDEHFTDLLVRALKM